MLRQIGARASPTFDVLRGWDANNDWTFDWGVTGGTTSLVRLWGQLRTPRLYDLVLDAPGDGVVSAEAEALRRSHGVLFVVDSQIERGEGNVAALAAFRDVLKRLGRSLDELPVVFLVNKRDLTNVSSLSEATQRLTWPRCAHVPTVATTGEGVRESVDALLDLLLVNPA